MTFAKKKHLPKKALPKIVKYFSFKYYYNYIRLFQPIKNQRCYHNCRNQSTDLQ